MVRGLVLALLLVALAAGCGDGDKKGSGTEATTAGGTTTTAEPDTTSTPTTTTAPEEETLAYQTWFTRDGQLQLTWVEGDKTIGVLTQAIQLLLAGPSSGDDDTAIPADTELINIDLAGGTATIDLSGEFFEPSGLAVAQVVYTATQYPTIRAVRILVEGQKHPLAGTPLRRRNFLNLLPPIVVERPTGLDPVGSTFTVAGSANVFEANVTIRVLDENGDEPLQRLHHGHLRNRLPRAVHQGSPGRLRRRHLGHARGTGRRRRRRREAELRGSDPARVQLSRR